MKNQGSKNSAWGTVILNENEISFLKLVATELTYKEIAQKMKISPRTIDNYRDALFLKLNVKSRVGLGNVCCKKRNCNHQLLIINQLIYFASHT